MNFNQILIRLGIDATAVPAGLAKTTAYVKGWGTSLAHDMKSGLFRMFAAGFVADKMIEGLSEIKGKILEIHRAQEDLGGGAITNFLQSMFNLSERMGISYEGLSTPLIKFKRTLDQAKLDPQGIQAQNLVRYGIITNVADLKTQDFVKSLGKLSDAYVKSGKNLKILQDMGIRMGGNFPAFQNIMSLGGKAIEDMNKDNFFTKMTPETIESFSQFYSGAKKVGQITAATFANAFSATVNSIGGQNIVDALYGVKELEDQSDEKIAESLQMEQKRVEINEKLRALLFEQSTLQSEIADRNKESVKSMADTARKALGLISPLQMASHTVTPLMRQALKIDTLEERATIASRRGDPLLAGRLQGEADQLRASNQNLRRADRNPMEGTEFKLEQIQQELAPISDMATFINKNSAP